jgi:Arm DNA-binding domain
MASIRQHRGRLLIDYRDSGSRQRVYTKLTDTPANRMQLQRIADLLTPTEN